MPLKNKCVCCKQWLLGVNCKEERFFLGVFFQHFHLFSFQIIFSAFNKMIYYLIISRINICIVSEVKGREWLLSFKKLEMPFTDKNILFAFFFLIFAFKRHRACRLAWPWNYESDWCDINAYFELSKLPQLKRKNGNSTLLPKDDLLQTTLFYIITCSWLNVFFQVDQLLTMYFYICTSIYTHIFCIFVIGLKKKCFDQLKPSVSSQWSPGYFLQLIFAVRLAIIKLQDSLDSFKMHNDKPMCNLQRSSFSRCHWVRLEWHCVKIPNFTVLKGCLQSGTKQKKSGLYGYYCPSLSTLLLPPWVTGPSPFHCVCAAGAFIFKNKLFD